MEDAPKQDVKRALHGVRILGTGGYSPKNVVKNSDLQQRGYDSEWIVKRTGIQSRNHVSPGQASSDLAIEAAQECLRNAGVDASEIDLILVSTMTPDHFTPSTACLVQAALGSTCGALDVNAACTGFIYAMTTGAQFVKCGTMQKVLVIAAETMSMMVDPEDKKTYPLFGDGAAAVLLGTDPNPNLDEASGILDFRLASVGDMAGHLVIPGGCSRIPASHEMIDKRQQYLQMEGRQVFKWAVRLIPEIVNESLEMAGLRLEDIDLLILHQANERILTAAIENLGIDEDKVFMNIADYGNTSSASVPISLNDACNAGKVKRGDIVFLAGFGSGLTWATCMLRW